MATYTMPESLVEKIDNARREAARGIESVASTVRSAADLAEGAAIGLDQTADVIRSYHPAESVGRGIRNHPGFVLLCGIGAGLFLGHRFRGKTDGRRQDRLPHSY